MPTKYSYGTFANYSPRGKSDLSVRSQKIVGRIKAGEVAVLESALAHLKEPKAQILQPFLNPDVTLVPVPRSAPLAKEALWPSKVISDVLVKNGLGASVHAMIERIRAVRKSSTAIAIERPLIPEHMDSMQVTQDMLIPDEITLIDDVLTRGATTAACARILQNQFPTASIRIFAMMRTQSFEADIKKIVDPSIGEIIAYDSGKPYRNP